MMAKIARYASANSQKEDEEEKKSEKFEKIMQSKLDQQREDALALLAWRRKWYESKNRARQRRGGEQARRIEGIDIGSAKRNGK